MSEIIKGKRLTGERALFGSESLCIEDCIFADGESPLKESKNISVKNSSFQWKYPLWYCENVKVCDCNVQEMGRAGVWYSNNVSIINTLYGAPKGFRKVKGLRLSNVDIPDAAETLWFCEDVVADNILAKGSYFAMNSKNMTFDNLRLDGDYGFDGCENVTVTNSTMMTKDAFWNCNNITVKDSYITGEYFGWNSSNITLENCTIESLQGFCYIENLKLINCKLINTTLAFEYSTVDVESLTPIDSVINPSGGIIKAPSIKELILDEKEIDKKATTFVLEQE